MVGPAVVNVSTETVDRQTGHPYSSFGGDPFFEHFFRDFFESLPQQEFRRTSLGSGVIIDGKKGFVLTNAHVIGRATTITVTLQDERSYTADIVGADPDSDLAVLRIAADAPLPAIAMGSSDDLMIGETVIAIGNPFGFSHTVTTGVISAINRSIRAEEQVFRDFIQIDASINPGNSGGPLLNIDGALIGINTAIYAKAQGIGFAIPINTARRIVNDLILFGEVVQPWLGLTIQALDSKLADYLDVPGRRGVVVHKVVTGSPADSARVKSGDILLSMDQTPVGSIDDYDGALSRIRTGDAVALTLWRDRRRLTTSLKAAVFPESLALPLAQALLGITIADIDGDLRQRYRILADEGVVITESRPQTDLDRIGIRPGDVIRQVDDMNIAGIDDFKKAVVKYRRKKSVTMVIQRGRQGYTITVRLN
ncbi:MAG: trypsin-like peptidase domain-containing protein [Pseudomonadota bacterium]